MRQTLSPSDADTASQVKPSSTGERVNLYLLDLDRLLARIEHATTHYQILGLDCDALREAIDRAFRETLTMLYPPYQISATLPAVLLVRIEQAFNKVTQAFSVLANFARRRDYDTALSAVTTPSPAGNQSQTASSQAIEIKSEIAPQAAYVESAADASNDNRRRTDRYKLAIPVRVTGFDRKAGDKWAEMTETLDLSRTGLRLRLHRQVRYGMVLYLSLPLPPKLRAHGFTDASYNVYALVRRIEPSKKGVRIIGLEFIGEHPPAGYLEKPWTVFRMKSWVGNERRRAPRLPHSEPVRIEYISEATQSMIREEAMTENVSRTGLRVIVRAAPSEFDLLRIISPARQFEAMAALRNRFMGDDGLERLCLQLLDKEWPVDFKRRERLILS